MRRSKKPLIIASRQSPLARAQAQLVGQMLARLHPRIPIEFIHVESEGDAITEGSLAQAGGKGLFTRAVERVVLDGKADIAVHSLKDMPATDVLKRKGKKLVIVAVPRRADYRDCFIGPDTNSIDELPNAAKIGTSSPRRAAQINRLRPDIQIQLLRGNVQTRIRKVIEDNQASATLLAKAGLERLGLSEYTNNPIDPNIMLPSAGQGALAIQCRLDDHSSMIRCLPLNHAISAAAVTAEQQIVAGLDGDCHSPIAVLAEPFTEGDTQLFRLRAKVLSPIGDRCIEADHRCTSAQLPQVVKNTLDELSEAGASDLLSLPPVATSTT